MPSIVIASGTDIKFPSKCSSCLSEVEGTAHPLLYRMIGPLGIFRSLEEFSVPYCSACLNKVTSYATKFKTLYWLAVGWIALVILFGSGVKASLSSHSWEIFCYVWGWSLGAIIISFLVFWGRYKRVSGLAFKPQGKKWYLEFKNSTYFQLFNEVNQLHS